MLSPVLVHTQLMQEAMTAWALALKLTGPSTDVRLITELRASMQDPNRVGAS